MAPWKGNAVNTGSAQRVLTKPWLRPAVSALVALTEESVDVEVIRRDPGLVLHVLRFARPSATPDSFQLDSATLVQPGLCETAAALLERDTCPNPLDFSARKRGRCCATVAEQLARKFGTANPDAAWACALLVGYFADSPTLVRRQLARWRIPDWVTMTVGHLDLPLEDAVTLGGDRGVMRTVRAAARATGEITLFPERDEELDEYAPFELEAARESEASEQPGAPDEQNPLLPRLLRLCGRMRQRCGSALIPELEQRIERLVGVVNGARRGFDSAIRDAKLDALAEFAAGASHEINNPLAVITTNAQLLRYAEEEPERLDRYDTILRQAKRISEILHGTRQFARPPLPAPTFLTTATWVNAIATEYRPLAEERVVQLDLPTTGLTSGRIWADPVHVRTIIGHLVQNAIEAAGRGGRVSVRVEAQIARTRVVIEDSGPGPNRAALPHLFDPFYSGRNAGRGRGLGLAIAWRLARQNGGDVAYDSLPGRPTRFVVTLPATPGEQALGGSERLSA